MQVAELVLEMTGSKSEIINKPLPEDDPRQRQPDISLARKALDWEPGVQLTDGLGRTIEFFRTLVGPRKPQITSIKSA